MPTNLVEAERNGATLVQRLAKIDRPSSSGKRELALNDSTNSNKKKANGHKEEGSGLHVYVIMCRPYTCIAIQHHSVHSAASLSAYTRHALHVTAEVQRC